MNQKQQYCTKCGQEITSQTIFCVHCGLQMKKSTNDKKGILSFFGWFTIVLVAVLISLAVVYGDSNHEDNTTSQESYQEEAVLPANTTSLPQSANQIDQSTCYGNIRDLEFIEKRTKLWSLTVLDPELESNPNGLKMYGIIKNNSSDCVAKNIKVRFALVKDDGTIMQQENRTLKNLDINQILCGRSERCNLYVSPGSTREYSEIFDVYDALLTNSSRSPYDRKLFSSITKYQFNIISADWIKAQGAQ